MEQSTRGYSDQDLPAGSIITVIYYENGTRMAQVLKDIPKDFFMDGKDGLDNMEELEKLGYLKLLPELKLELFPFTGEALSNSVHHHSTFIEKSSYDAD